MIPIRNKKKTLKVTVEEMRNFALAYVEKYAPSKQQLKTYLLKKYLKTSVPNVKKQDVNNLIDIFDHKYYGHLSGGILEAFSKLFHKDLKVYLYPMLNEDGNLITSDNLKVHPRVKELYKFFKYTGKLVDIENYKPEILNIFSRRVLKMINSGEEGWEPMLPAVISDMIKVQRLFGYTEK